MKTEDVSAADRTDVGSRTVALAMALFAIIIVLIAFDVAADWHSETKPSHIFTKATVMVLALAGVMALWPRFRFAQSRAERLTVDLDAARKEAARFREEAGEALRGLGEAIQSQCRLWGLSPAESEVGLLLLKGLTHKEIAEVRSTGETTIPAEDLSCIWKLLCMPLVVPRPS